VADPHGPGIEVETVYIPSVGRSGALCVSSQVGCTLNCSFCHTGTQALVRNLTAAEIVAQVQIAKDDLAEWPSDKDDRLLSNIVFMGMGEPLYNLGQVADAIEIISDNEGIAISRRRITVSTSGVVPQLDALGDKTQAMLAISLHATNDALRDVLVPLNKKYPLDQLMAGIRAYPGLSNARRVTFEYVMLKGVNDSPDEARALVKLIKGIPAKVNLIPFNPWPGTDYQCSDWARSRPSPRSSTGRLLLADPHAAGPRHPGRLRPAEEREREGPRLGDAQAVDGGHGRRAGRRRGRGGGLMPEPTAASGRTPR
jgi:23S rRNA (adenine2503-C2)-methyltransferase